MCFVCLRSALLPNALPPHKLFAHAYRQAGDAFEAVKESSKSAVSTAAEVASDAKNVIADKVSSLMC